MAIFKGRVRVRYGYSRWGYTRNNGKGWHGGSDEEGWTAPPSGCPIIRAKKHFRAGRYGPQRLNRSTGSKTWNGAGTCAWSWTRPDAGRGELPVFLPQRAESGIRGPAGEKSGDALAVMAARATRPWQARPLRTAISRCGPQPPGRGLTQRHTPGTPTPWVHTVKQSTKRRKAT